jgi:hypothetical protein
MKQLPPFSPEFEDARLKLLIKFDEIMAREGIEGFQKASGPPSGGQMAVLDPATGQIAWRALACFNPDCSARGKGGGPYLFAYPVKSIKIGPDGKLMLDKTVNDQPSDPLGAQCPVCGSHDFCRPYEPAETVLRRRGLMKELASIRKVKKTAPNAQADGTHQPRTASDVMKELTELDKLFIVPLADKVKTANDLISPIADVSK